MFTINIGDDILLRLVDMYQFDAAYQTVINNLEHIGQFLPWANKTDYNRDDLEQFIFASRQEFAKGIGYRATIFFGGLPVGNIGLTIRDSAARRGEIFYWLSKTVAGQGIMTKAARAMCDYGFGTLGLNKITIRAQPENKPSWSIAERLNFQLEGVFRQEAINRGQLIDLRSYAMFADDWQHTLIAPEFEYVLGDGYALRPIETRYAVPLSRVINENYHHLKPWLPWARPDITPDEEVIFIEAAQQRYAANNGGDYLIFHHARDIVGACGYHYWDFIGGNFEIGYWLAKAHTGQGIMTHAIRKLCDYAMDVMGLNRALILCAPDNYPSAAVPKRLGFTYDKQIKRDHPQTGDTQLLDQYYLLKKERIW